MINLYTYEIIFQYRRCVTYQILPWFLPCMYNMLYSPLVLPYILPWIYPLIHGHHGFCQQEVYASVPRALWAEIINLHGASWQQNRAFLLEHHGRIMG